MIRSPQSLSAVGAAVRGGVARSPWRRAPESRASHLTARRRGGLGVGTLVLVVIVALLCAGCGHKALDTSRAEAVITRKLTVAYAPLKVGRAACPATTKLGKGAAFRCTVDVGGARLGISVTQTDSAGAVTFVTDQALIDVAKVEADLTKKLRAAYGEPGDVLTVAVGCPGGRVRALPKGATFRCNVTMSDEHLVEVVTVDNIRGGVSYSATS